MKNVELVEEYADHDFEWVTLDIYYVKYWLNKDYKNTQLKVKVKDNANIMELREAIAKAYGYKESSYLMTWVVNK